MPEADLSNIIIISDRIRLNVNRILAVARDESLTDAQKIDLFEPLLLTLLDLSATLDNWCIESVLGVF